jgi:predicted NBD/HSP70 family sugar kinase
MSAVLKKSELLRKEILKQLYFNAPLSLTSVSKLTQKSVPMVTTAIADLVAEKYVTDDGLAPSSGGRRPLLYLLNPAKKRYIVAVAIDQMVTRMVIYHISKKAFTPQKSLEINVLSDENALPQLIAFIKENITKSGLLPEQILGVGIGMPGFVNVETGVNHSIFPINDGSSLRNHLKKQLELPVFIDNDSCLIALAELKFGKAKNRQDAMVINIGWGTGLGMIVNGQIFRGHSGFAGEFSHIPLSASNNLCSCGKRGCLEVETSILVMAKKAQAELDMGSESSLRRLLEDKTKHPGDQFLEAARLGDPLALSILSESSFHLGKGIATLIHVMNPEKIILSGRGAIAGKMFIPAIQQAINEFCIPRIAECTTIEVSEIAHEAELIGAANLVIEHNQFN